MYLSNLRSYIKALDGKRSIVAEFPQGKVAITKLADPAADTLSD